MVDVWAMQLSSSKDDQRPKFNSATTMREICSTRDPGKSSYFMVYARCCVRVMARFLEHTGVKIRCLLICPAFTWFVWRNVLPHGRWLFGEGGGGMKHAKSWHLYSWPSEVVSGRTEGSLLCL